MQCTKIDSNIQKRVALLLDQYPLIKPIISAIHDAHGRAFLVGGTVRDFFLQKTIKDIDIEVHGISMEVLEKLLRSFGVVSLVGKSFGVLRLHGLAVDWSLPRIDSAGRKPRVTIDPFMGIEQSFERRDLTMNAMGIDLVTYVLIDPFNGRQDLQDKILRTPNVHLFVEDPLRLFRVMQFIGRFEMKPDKELDNICSTMDIRGVSRERIESEFEKLLLKSRAPSYGIRWLKLISRIQDILPELAATIGVPQDPVWHPEGDVFEHTMQTLDAMALIIMQEYAHVPENDAEINQDTQKLALMYAALCHDLGKTTTTEKVNGSITSIGHEKESERCTRKLLNRITKNKKIRAMVSILVRYHMMPLHLVEGRAKLAAYKRLARKLAPDVTLQMLAYLARADRLGRNKDGHEPLSVPVKDVDLFLLQAQKAFVVHQPEKPVLRGYDLLDIIDPGPVMGTLLRYAYDIQLEHGIKDKAVLKQRVIEYMKSKK